MLAIVKNVRIRAVRVRGTICNKAVTLNHASVACLACQVKLRTNKPIGAHYLSGGATGRIQIHLVDFDLDGTVDLLVCVN